MEIVLKFTIEHTGHGRPDMPDPHLVAEALAEHLGDPADPEELVFSVQRPRRRPIDLRYRDPEIISVSA